MTSRSHWFTFRRSPKTPMALPRRPTTTTGGQLSLSRAAVLPHHHHRRRRHSLLPLSRPGQAIEDGGVERSASDPAFLLFADSSALRFCWDQQRRAAVQRRRGGVPARGRWQRLGISSEGQCMTKRYTKARSVLMSCGVLF